MKKTDRYLSYLVLLCMLLLFLVTLLVLSFFEAGMIRDTLMEDGRTAIEERQSLFRGKQKELSQDGVSVEDAVWDYYRMLAAMGEKEQFPSQVTTFSDLYITKASYTDVVQPENERLVASMGWCNMLLAEFRDQDGNTHRIPAAFLTDHTADVEYIMDRELGPEYRYRFTGYWDQYLHVFFLTEFVQYKKSGFPPILQYTTAAYPPEAAVMQTYEFGGVTILRLRESPRATGKADYSAAEQRTEQLRSRVLNAIPGDNRLDEIYNLDSDLKTVTMTGVTSVLETQDHTTYKIRYIFALSFSPIGMAWRQIWFGGPGFTLLILYIFGGVLMILGISAFRAGEIQRLQDEIIRMEQAVNYAKDAEESRREMTSAIAHELKTPIAVLSSYGQALQERIDPEKQEKYLSVIQEEADRMDRMVQELLDYSRLEAGKYKLRREDFDLEELCRKILKPLEPQLQEKEILIQWQVDKSRINADPYRMGQVVENFLTNAIRHSTQGGTIILRIGTGRETLSVENQGKQIPADQLSKVWETFWQGDTSRNERGSGLGLAIVRTIVNLHGGTCKAENTATGVRFSVSLEPTRRLYQMGSFPQEEIISLSFPISTLTVSVETVMRRLGMMEKAALKQEIREGTVLVGTEPVKTPGQKLSAGDILIWKEYRISIVEDGGDKSRAFLVDRMRPGSLGNIDIAQNGSITVGH